MTNNERELIRMLRFVLNDENSIIDPETALLIESTIAEVLGSKEETA